MNRQYIGEVRAFAGFEVPDGWLPCDGQALPTSDYPELYTVIGARYGSRPGYFNLPDLRARAVMGAGQGAGLTTRELGDKTGAAYVALEERHLTRHKHRVYAHKANPHTKGDLAHTSGQSWHDGRSQNPGQDSAAHPADPPSQQGERWLVLESLARHSIGARTPPGTTPAVIPVQLGETARAGGTAEQTSAQPHENRQPCLGVQFCIAWR